MKIWNKRDKHARGYLVDRTTPFGNPFVVGRHGTREEVIALYRAWVWKPEQQALRNLMREKLTGKDLICWCAPQACHAEIIAEITLTPKE
jgi:hypothetical protein